MPRLEGYNVIFYKTCEQKPKGIERACFSDVWERKSSVEELSSTKILRLGHLCSKKNKEKGVAGMWLAWGTVVEMRSES